MAKTYTTQQAADQCGWTEGYIRQLLIKQNAAGNPIGAKFGRAWIMTGADLRAIRKLPGVGSKPRSK